jgi:hypothetical protein
MPLSKYIFVDKALCNEFIGRLNLRNYEIVYSHVVCFSGLPKKTTLLIVQDTHSARDFINNDYVCNRDPSTICIKTLDTGCILIYEGCQML